MRALIVIPARGGSKGLPDKNIMDLMGKPLIGYTIDAARKASLPDRIAVSTEDERIAEVAGGFGVQVIPRPPEYATDEAPIEWALRHAVRYLAETEGYSPEIVVWLQANLPLRRDGQIDRVIRKLMETGADSVITITEVTKRPEYMKQMVEGDRILHMAMPEKFRRQDYTDRLYVADGAVLAMRTEVLMGTEGMTGTHVYLGKDIRGVVQEPRYAIEIDDQFDYDVVLGLLIVEGLRKGSIQIPGLKGR
jgi:CMP-N,N'-diacetyllegionaminic acid synthase